MTYYDKVKNAFRKMFEKELTKKQVKRQIRFNLTLMFLFSIMSIILFLQSNEYGILIITTFCNMMLMTSTLFYLLDLVGLEK